MRIDEISVDVDELLRDSISFEDTLQGFSNSKTGMTAKMNELNATWSGPAKDAFMQQFQKDCELLEELQNLLKEMSETTKYAHDSYQSAEDTVQNIVRGIKI